MFTWRNSGTQGALSISYSGGLMVRRGVAEAGTGWRRARQRGNEVKTRYAKSLRAQCY